MIDNQWDEFEPQRELPEPRWTLRKVIYLAIILLTLIIFVLYTLWPVFFPPAPPYMPLPHQQA
jgi:4-hydroxybenzoate polyprenyltransferase